MHPAAGVLHRFAARELAYLGGRLNKHWLIESRDRQLVLRRWAATPASIAYETRLLRELAALGWPVAPVLEEPIEAEGHVWSLANFLPGEPPATADPNTEQRARGRLLAEFHAALAGLPDRPQRAPWRRCETILADTSLDELLAANEPAQPEAIRILRWHLDRARERIAQLNPSPLPGQIIHGDFTPWNLRFHDGRLSGILDFELSHWDHRSADFALSWRGHYDAVIHGYHEVAPLSPEEWQLLTPMWWAFLLEGACRDLRHGTPDDGWTFKKLLQRSPLMGPDAGEYNAG